MEKVEAVASGVRTEKGRCWQQNGLAWVKRGARSVGYHEQQSTSALPLAKVTNAAELAHWSALLERGGQRGPSPLPVPGDAVPVQHDLADRRVACDPFFAYGEL